MPTRAINSTQILELDYPSRLRQRTVWALLSILLLWSFGLRLWYATPQLDSTRFWDERYGLENLEPLLKDGQLRPVHGFHPGFSYLPHGLVLKISDLLYQTTGRQEFAIFDARGRYTASTYMICRTISVLFGTASLLLVFLMGRRMGGDRLGLLAAFFLSVVPWHLRQSILFKADIALLFTVVLTFYLSLRAVEKPLLRRFAATGVSIGLALSSKFNAGPIAIPLTVGAFLRKGSKKRALLLLVVAAAVSVAVFLALQPYALIDPDIYRRSMASTSRIYEKFAAHEDHGRLYLFWHLVKTLHSGSFHGPVIGLLAVVGLTSATALSLRRFRQSSTALSWVMAACYIVAYAALYALATPRPSPHNWLPISPFAALGAAWALLAGWRLLTLRFSDRQRRLTGALALASIVLVLAWQTTHYTYRETVPDTGDRALEVLRSRVGKPDGRHIVTEYRFSKLFQERHRRGRLGIQWAEDLQTVPRKTLDRSDAEVFYSSRLDDTQSQAFFEGRVQRLRSRDVVTIEPRLFFAWGPPVVVLIHPWKVKAETNGTLLRSPTDPQLYLAELPVDEANSDLVSIVLSVPRRMALSDISVDGTPLEYVLYRGPRLQMPRSTFRFEPGSELQVRMRKGEGRDSIPFSLRRWSQPRLRRNKASRD